MRARVCNSRGHSQKVAPRSGWCASQTAGLHRRSFQGRPSPASTWKGAKATKNRGHSADGSMIYTHFFKRAEQENCTLRERAERAEQENRTLKEQLERAERAAHTSRTEELARERALPTCNAPRSNHDHIEDGWKLPRTPASVQEHYSGGIYKLLVKGAIPLNDPSITNKQIARLLEEHDLLASPDPPRGDFRPVDLPRPTCNGTSAKQ